MLARQEERLWQKLWEIHQNHAAVSRIASRLEGRFAPNAAYPYIRCYDTRNSF